MFVTPVSPIRWEQHAVSKASKCSPAELCHREGFFVADILAAAPKGDTVSMEHPLFALKAGDRRVRTYERNGLVVTVKPGADGCASIHDKDLWIYCISQLVEAKNRGRPIAPTVRFTAYDFLRSTNRSTGGLSYRRIAGMLARLRGTGIETNIETNGQRERRGFGLIDSWRIVEKSPTDDRVIAIEVDLPHWLFRSVATMRVLTLSRDYFKLRKPLERRIYELARKHCGLQPKWRVSVMVLYAKSGSTATLREFRRQVKELSGINLLPDYQMSLDTEHDHVTFFTK
ncbi:MULTISPECIES: replication initiator protein A [Gluconobacter]|uniref:replication initiator protein A n=1 Tax=Gluconobacter TaxID=441 RepID=UPI001F2E19C7|nr:MULTISPECIES: replication initiator protein A [Gluconobacter]